MRLLILLLLLPLGLAAQVQEPFRKANTIIIKTDFPAEENYMKFGKHLIDNGYQIANSNKDFLSLSTEMKDLGSRSANYALYASFAGNKIILTSKFTITMTVGLVGEYNYDWKYTSKSNTHYKVYEDFLPVIESYGGQILYAKK